MGRSLNQFAFIKDHLKSFSCFTFSIVSTITLSASLPTFLVIPISSFSLINESPKEVIDQVWQIIYRDYLDSSGKYSAKEWKKLRHKILKSSYINRDQSYEAIRGMLLTLDDPYTRFLDPKEFKEMRIDTSGSLSGVGIQLSLDKRSNKLIVVSPIEGTPADRAGVESNDVIISIDGIPTKGMSIENAVKLIRGKKGTKVVLGFKRENKIFKVELIRDKIKINTVISRLNSLPNGINVGYIRLKQFNANASREMNLAIKKLEKKNSLGYILDLRSNPGGLLEASVDISRQWLDKGTIVSTQTRNGIRDIRKANGRSLTSKPLVVLVNEGSASASEIVSGAIQDNERGILVGKKTFGKGLVQSVRGLSDGSGLTVTIAKYLTPKGTDIHKNGIVPDVFADLSDSDVKKLTAADIGTKKDNQYVVAENILVRSILNQNNKGMYIPGKANLKNTNINN